jgi:nucleoside diphosphate kinase
MKEKTIFIIKPDAYDVSTKIKYEISEKFKILLQGTFKFNENLIAKFYPLDIGKPHYPALLEYMLERPCDFGVIEDEQAILRFLEFAGKYSNPPGCDPHSLRYQYGKGLDRTKSGLYIVKNAIHRSKTPERVGSELDLLRINKII